MNRCLTGFLNLAELFFKKFKWKNEKNEKIENNGQKNGQFQIMDKKKWTNDNNGHIMDKLWPLMDF